MMTSAYEVKLQDAVVKAMRKNYHNDVDELLTNNLEELLWDTIVEVSKHKCHALLTSIYS